jgi:hypothetical protein
MRIITVLDVRNCSDRQQKHTNEFVMHMVISRYQKGWLKWCQKNKTEGFK